MSSTLQSLKYTRGSLSVIDQLKLPTELEFIDIHTVQDAWDVIRTMQVRGAPLIAIVAALGLAVNVESRRSEFTDAASASQFLLISMEHLRTSRPTAVNLFVATDELKTIVQSLVAHPDATAASVIDGYILAAEKILSDDVATNVAIGDHGAKKILEITGREKIRILTICNTGSLATAGYGTALGVVRSLHALGKLEHVYACETRPYNQGARLTAFEIVEDKLPGTLIADSMASYLMAVRGVDAVVVGADRVAANGDTANKIGTYQLAITAKHHGIPFFTAVPTTTLDLTMSSGTEIHVEERPAVEMTSIFGQKIAPDGIAVWNPSFDVTPCSLIRGVITEVGVAESKGDADVIDIAAFLRSQGLEGRTVGAVAPTDAPIGYRRFDEKGIATYVAALPKTQAILGLGSDPTVGAEQLTVAEVGDGNLNFVYIVTGPSGGKVVAKQALPYVRCVGESWPLTLERAAFETNALVAERALSPEYVPEVYHFDKTNSLIVMRFIEPPHQILRKSFAQELRISTFASHLASFLASTLYGTSSLALDGGTFRLRVAQWSRNTAMCALTEQVIFSDPYRVSPVNRWTTPQLDSYATGIRSDVALKVAAAALKSKFLTSTQALIHADLHTGSVMATEGSTFVIDPEFGFYGPMGFDIGALLSNLLMAYFAQAAYEKADYAEWILAQTVALYEEFYTRFLALWTEDNVAGKSGELYKVDIFSGEALVAAQSSFMRSLWLDTLGFTGMKIIRRIVGIAHVADLDSIQDPDVRSMSEKRSLLLARRLVLASQGEDLTGLESITGLAQASRELYASRPSDSWVV